MIGFGKPCRDKKGATYINIVVRGPGWRQTSKVGGLEEKAGSWLAFSCRPVWSTTIETMQKSKKT